VDVVSLTVAIVVAVDVFLTKGVLVVVETGVDQDEPFHWTKGGGVDVTKSPCDTSVLASF